MAVAQAWKMQDKNSLFFFLKGLSLPCRLVESRVGVDPEAAASDKILFIRLLFTIGVPLLDAFVILVVFSVLVLCNTSSSSRKSRVSSRSR